jgi:hypothetical protein
LQDDEIRTLEDANRAHIKATLRETNWLVGGSSGAAARLGMHRTTLIAMMARLGTSRSDGAIRSRRSNRDLCVFQYDGSGAWSIHLEQYNF